MQRSIEEALFIDDVRALAAGKMTSTMLEVAVEMELFRKLDGRRVELAELAELLQLPLWSARVIAQFLCREGLLIYEDGQLSNGPGVGPFLVTENLDFEELRKVMAFRLSKEELKHLLRNPLPENGYERLSKEEHHLSLNVLRMAWGEQLAQLYSFKGHRLLLDVAGASGGIPLGIRKTNPHLRCILFDHPESAEYAAKNIAAAGAGELIRFVGGSFLTDDLPRGADIALLSNIIHNWTPEEDQLILSKIHEALEPGGTLLVREAFFEDDWTGPMEAVFHAFFMGRDTWQPTYGEVEDMMEKAGFVDIERRFDIFGIVMGRKEWTPGGGAAEPGGSPISG
jgi:SAM-dependent methyltransferase